MSNDTLGRRDFHRLTMAALGGVAAGVATGGGNSTAFAQEEKKESKLPDPGLLLAEPHACKGLSTCRTHGAGGDNACAGQGKCASVEAHTCKGMNACKGQGGCGGYPGQNACKGSGSCAVPLSKETWALARKQFEEVMKASGKEIGAAPKS